MDQLYGEPGSAAKANPNRLDTPPRCSHAPGMMMAPRILVPLAAVMALASGVVWAQDPDDRILYEGPAGTLTYKEFVQHISHLGDNHTPDGIRTDIKITEAGDSLFPVCLDLLRTSEDLSVVTYCIHAVIEFADDPAIYRKDLLAPFSRAGLASSREFSLNLLVVLDVVGGPEDAELLYPLLLHPSVPKVRAAAASMLAKMGDAETLAHLQSLRETLDALHDDDLEGIDELRVRLMNDGRGSEFAELVVSDERARMNRVAESVVAAIEDLRARLESEQAVPGVGAESDAEQLTEAASIVLSNGETLTAEEVEFGLDWEQNRGERFEQIRSKVALAGRDIIPLYRAVVEGSDESFAVTVALRLLSELELDTRTASEVAATLAGRPSMLGVGGVSGSLLSFVEVYELASHVPSVAPMLNADERGVRSAAFKVMAKLGDAETLALLEERREQLHQAAVEELTALSASLSSAPGPDGTTPADLLAVDLQFLDRRWNELAVTQLREMRARLGLAPASNAVPQQDRILFEGERGVLTYSELVERFSHPDNSHTDEGIATEYKIAEAGDQLIPVWVELLRTSDRRGAVANAIFLLLQSAPDPNVYRDDLLSPFGRKVLSSPGTLIRVLESVGRPEDVEMLYPLLLHPESSRVRLHAARVLVKIGDANTLAHLESLRESLISLYEADLESADKTRADLIGAGWNTAFVERAVRDRGSWLIWATDGVDSAVPALRQRLETPDARTIPWTVVIAAVVGLLAVVAGVVAVRCRRGSGDRVR